MCRVVSEAQADVGSVAHQHLVRDLTLVGLETRRADQDQAAQALGLERGELGGDEATEPEAYQSEVGEPESLEHSAQDHREVARFPRPLRSLGAAIARQIGHGHREATRELRVEGTPAGVPRRVGEHDQRLTAVRIDELGATA